MVGETRAAWADVAARASVAGEGESVTDTRSQLAEVTGSGFASGPQEAGQTAANLSAAYTDGMIELG